MHAVSRTSKQELQPLLHYLFTRRQACLTDEGVYFQHPL